MAKIYKSFEELINSNQTIFNILSKNEEMAVFQAIWDARTPELAALKKKLSEAIKKTTTLSSKSSSLREQVTTLSEGNRQSNQKIAKLEKSQKTLKSHLKKSQQESSQRQVLLEKTISEMNERQSQFDRSVVLERKHKSEKAKNEAFISQLEAALDLQRIESQEIRSEWEITIEDKKALQSEVKDRDSQINELKKTISKLEAKINSLTVQRNNQDGEIQDLQGLILQMKKNQEEKLSSITENIDRAMDQFEIAKKMMASAVNTQTDSDRKRSTLSPRQSLTC